MIIVCMYVCTCIMLKVVCIERVPPHLFKEILYDEYQVCLAIVYKVKTGYKTHQFLCCMFLFSLSFVPWP